ncbi:hypothetical protein [Rhodococcus sp. 21391]|uniref:hypothetical protein n=1 Tax=Rhodococcus sp. 21391 TaxID=2683591 RepID=UPI000AA4C148|nr:hypothetical protein [Rhodococcus sp. 21391]
MSASIGLPRVMRIGGGAVAEIGSVVASLGFSRPLVVTDNVLVGTGAAATMMKWSNDTQFRNHYSMPTHE